MSASATAFSSGLRLPLPVFAYHAVPAPSRVALWELQSTFAPRYTAGHGTASSDFQLLSVTQLPFRGSQPRGCSRFRFLTATSGPWLSAKALSSGLRFPLPVFTCNFRRALLFPLRAALRSGSCSPFPPRVPWPGIGPEAPSELHPPCFPAAPLPHGGAAALVRGRSPFPHRTGAEPCFNGLAAMAHAEPERSRRIPGTGGSETAVGAFRTSVERAHGGIGAQRSRQRLRRKELPEGGQEMRRSREAG